MNPLFIRASTASADTYGRQDFVLPVRFFPKTQKAVVFELLAVDYYMGAQDLADTTHTYWTYLSLGTGRLAGAVPLLVDLAEDAQNDLTLALVATHRGTLTEGGAVVNMPYHVDMTDGAGNGFLIGINHITLIGASDAATTGISHTAVLKYRLKTVSTVEYLRISQSQSVRGNNTV